MLSSWNKHVHAVAAICALVVFRVATEISRTVNGTIAVLGLEWRSNQSVQPLSGMMLVLVM